MKNMMKATFLIHGMHCKSCAIKIIRAFKKVNGVIHTELFYKDEKITISFDRTTVNFKDLSKVIEPLGYYLGHKRKDTIEIKKREVETSK